MPGILNNKNKKHFTELLEDLVCNKACDLQKALLLLSTSKSTGRNHKQVYKAAQNIYASLKHGNAFSASLKNCPFIEFDPLYICFMSFAERCGKLEDTLKFLKKKCLREEENSAMVLQASVYPLFVVVVSVISVICLFCYSNALWQQQEFGINFSEELFSSFYLSFCFLLAFCVIAFFVLRRMLGTNRLYEAFLATGFLIKGGESLANAVNDAVIILGYDSKEGQLFAKAGKKLSYGVSLRTAFELDSKKSTWHQQLEEAFFFAENTGGESDVFEKIALWINGRDEKLRAVCFKLLEPFFICGTGIFLLVFLMNLVLPVFTQSTMIL